MTNEQMRDLVKECGLDWQRGYMPMFDGDPTNRYAVLVEAALDSERERCIAACTAVMNAYGGDPAGRLLSSERVLMQHQLQASGAAQCIGALVTPNAEVSGRPKGSPFDHEVRLRRPYLKIKD